MPRHNFPPDISIAIFAAFFAANFIVQPTSGWAQSGRENVDGRLQEVEKAIQAGQRKSSELDQTATSLRRELIEVREEKIRLAQSIRKRERTILQMETELRDLNQSEKQKLVKLKERRGQFSKILIALQRLSRMPPEAVIAYPAPPAELVRAAILLRSTVPRIEGRAMRLREDLIALADTRRLIADRRLVIATAASVLSERRRELDQIFEHKSVVRRQTLAARQVEIDRIDRLSREAKNLRELFTKLERERHERDEQAKKIQQYQSSKESVRTMPRPLIPRGALASLAPFETKPITTARGLLTFPVVGNINGGYGEKLSKGLRRKGLNIESGPGAQVVSPYNGKIVFAGTFRGYGQLLIIEHGEGYHSLLAGMSRIDGNVGQWLLSGEPVGIMGSPSSGSPMLYLELRKNGKSIDPNPWLATTKGKVNG